jgi:hypothetical protein
MGKCVYYAVQKTARITADQNHGKEEEINAIYLRNLQMFSVQLFLQPLEHNSVILQKKVALST